MRYDYLEAMKSDIQDYIEENINIQEYRYNTNRLYDKLYDELFCEDSVTGNASGSYTFNTYEAEENLCHNLDLLEEACRDFCDELEHAIKQGAEYCDVTIRCYLLSQAISEVLDELTFIEEEE